MKDILLVASLVVLAAVLILWASDRHAYQKRIDGIVEHFAEQAAEDAEVERLVLGMRNQEEPRIYTVADWLIEQHMSPMLDRLSPDLFVDDQWSHHFMIEFMDRLSSLDNDYEQIRVSNSDTELSVEFIDLDRRTLEMVANYVVTVVYGAAIPEFTWVSGSYGPSQIAETADLAVRKISAIIETSAGLANLKAQEAHA